MTISKAYRWIYPQANRWQSGKGKRQLTPDQARNLRLALARTAIVAVEIAQARYDLHADRTIKLGYHYRDIHALQVQQRDAKRTVPYAWYSTLDTYSALHQHAAWMLWAAMDHIKPDAATLHRDAAHCTQRMDRSLDAVIARCTNPTGATP